MNQLNESAADLYIRLLSELAPKARVSLERVKTACDTIETARGTMNYTRVADVATERFGGPRRQSIQNNKTLKQYIAKRIEESDCHQVSNKRRETEISRFSSYPAPGLDAKTRQHIDLLRADLSRLNSENDYLSKLLNRQTKRSPPSLSEALLAGAKNEMSLDIDLPEPDSIPSSVTTLVKTLLGLDESIGNLKRFEVQSRDHQQRIICTDGGVEMTISSPNAIKEIKKWVSTANITGSQRETDR